MHLWISQKSEWNIMMIATSSSSLVSRVSPSVAAFEAKKVFKISILVIHFVSNNRICLIWGYIHSFFPVTNWREGHSLHINSPPSYPFKSSMNTLWNMRYTLHEADHLLPDWCPPKTCHLLNIVSLWATWHYPTTIMTSHELKSWAHLYAGNFSTRKGSLKFDHHFTVCEGRISARLRHLPTGKRKSEVQPMKVCGSRGGTCTSSIST